jgi:hypothetical protein
MIDPKITQQADELINSLLNEEAEEEGADSKPEPKSEKKPEAKPKKEDKPEKKPEVETEGREEQPRPAGRSPETSEKYHGWTNRRTWNVALWINNEEGLYHLAKACNDYTEFAEQMRELGITETPDHVAYNDGALNLKELDGMIAELRSEGESPDELPDPDPTSGSGPEGDYESDETDVPPPNGDYEDPADPDTRRRPEPESEDEIPDPSK